MTDDELTRIKKDLLQENLIGSPADAKNLCDYIDQLRGQLAAMTRFLCTHHHSASIEEWVQAKPRIEKACSLLGLDGEKILANCGPEFKEHF